MEIRNHLFILKIRNSAGIELAKYTLVGISGFLVHLGLLYAFTEFVGVYYLVSSLLAGLLVSFYNFGMDKVWSFGEKIEARFFREYLSYMIVGGSSLVLKLILLWLFTDFFGIHYLFSQAIAIALLGLFTFICNEIWTFKSRRK